MSTDEYVPSEAHFRNYYVGGRSEYDPEYTDDMGARRDWDAYMARVRQEARAEGWERGHVCGYSDAQDTARNIAHGPHNPYTETGGPHAGR